VAQLYPRALGLEGYVSCNSVGPTGSQSLRVQMRFVSARTEQVAKSDVWFHYKEGFSNAVRRSVKIQELLNSGGV
jgi:hypothetical protein